MIGRVPGTVIPDFKFSKIRYIYKGFNKIANMIRWDKVANIWR